MATIDDLPDVLVADILQKVSATSRGLAHTLVSRSWHVAVTPMIRAICTKRGSKLAPETLLQELAAFPSVTSLCLERTSLLRLSDSFLHGLASQLPSLEKLYISKDAAVDFSIGPRGILGLLSELPRLKVLALPDMGYPYNLPDLSSCTRSLRSLTSLRVKGVPANMGALTSLTSLHLSSNNLQEVPDSIAAMSGLQTLVLDFTVLQRLPYSIGSLPALRSFSLHSKTLLYLPDSITALRQLAMLRLDCPELQELPASVEQMRWLQKSELRLRNLSTIPASFSKFTSLHTLEIGRGLSSLSDAQAVADPDAWCRSLGNSLSPGLRNLQVRPLRGIRTQSLGHDRARSSEDVCAQDSDDCEQWLLPRSLRDLCVRSFWGRDLPESICDLHRLRSLSLAVCPGLRSLPHFIGLLTSLHDISIELCAIEFLPESLCDLTKLSSLSISNCSQLRGLPFDFGFLASLRELRIENCGALEQLPVTFALLPALRVLSLRGCHNLKEMPSDIGGLACLSHLEISRCAAIRGLPHSLGDVGPLTALLLEDNNSLACLPQTLSRLVNLEQLQVSGCSRLGRVSHDLLYLPSLSQQSRACVQKLLTPACPRGPCSRRRSGVKAFMTRFLALS